MKGRSRVKHALILIWGIFIGEIIKGRNLFHFLLFILYLYHHLSPLDHTSSSLTNVNREYTAGQSYWRLPDHYTHHALVYKTNRVVCLSFCLLARDDIDDKLAVVHSCCFISQIATAASVKGRCRNGCIGKSNWTKSRLAPSLFPICTVYMFSPFLLWQIHFMPPIPSFFIAHPPRLFTIKSHWLEEKKLMAQTRMYIKMMWLRLWKKLQELQYQKYV